MYLTKRWFGPLVLLVVGIAFGSAYGLGENYWHQHASYLPSWYTWNVRVAILAALGLSVALQEDWEQIIGWCITDFIALIFPFAISFNAPTDMQSQHAFYVYISQFGPLSLLGITGSQYYFMIFGKTKSTPDIELHIYQTSSTDKRNLC